MIVQKFLSLRGQGYADAAPGPPDRVQPSLAALPEEWEYSNYLEWLGLREGTLANHEFIKENFGTPEEYEQLVMNYIKRRDSPDDVRKYLQDLED